MDREKRAILASYEIFMKKFNLFHMSILMGFDYILGRGRVGDMDGETRFLKDTMVLNCKILGVHQEIQVFVMLFYKTNITGSILRSLFLVLPEVLTNLPFF